MDPIDRTFGTIRSARSIGTIAAGNSIPSMNVRQVSVEFPTRSRGLILIGIAWLSMIGFDFFLHGGVLARWYVTPSPFLLPPPTAFARIPLGYLSFALLAVLLLWTLQRAKVEDWRHGAAIGLWIGSLVWGSLSLGLYSISTAPPGLLFGWFVGQSVELGIAGTVLGAGLSGHPLGRLFLMTLAFTVAAIVATVTLQILGVAPAITSG